MADSKRAKQSGHAKHGEQGDAEDKLGDRNLPAAEREAAAEEAAENEGSPSQARHTGEGVPGAEQSSIWHHGPNAEESNKNDPAGGPGSDT